MTTEPSTTEMTSRVEGHGPDGVPTTCTEPSCQAALAAGAEWMDAYMSTTPTADGHHLAAFHHVDTLHEEVAQHTREEFAEIVARYEADPSEFYASYHYLRLHPIFHRYEWRSEGQPPSLDAVSAEQLQSFEVVSHLEDEDGLRDMWTAVALVNPETLEVDDDSSLNTLTQVWLEHGPHMQGSDVHGTEYAWQFLITGHSSHDYELDCGGDTYEEAVVALAANVFARYGNDRSRVNEDRSEA